MKILFEIAYNFGVLISFTLISGFIAYKGKNNWHRGLTQGIMFGLASMIGMMHPLVLTPGLLFDGRSVMISLAGLFFGPLAALIAAGMALSLRMIIGGPGVVMGCLVIISSALIGVAFHVKQKNWNPVVPAKELFGMGVVVHVTMVLLMLTLPAGKALVAIKSMGLPILFIYPLATVLIGMVLSETNERNRMAEELQSQYLKLSQSEERFRTIFEQAPLGINLSDSDSRIIYKSNQRYCEIVGRPMDEVVGDSWMNFTHPEDVEQNIHLNDELIEGKTAVFEMDKRYVHPSGKSKWVNIKAVMFRDKDSSDVKEICFAEDITDKKIAQDALVASEHSFRNLFDGSADPILIIEENRITDCNHAAAELLGGNSKENVIGKTVWDLSPEQQSDGTDSKEGASKLLAQCKERTKIRFEWEHCKLDGQIIPVEVMLTAISQSGKDAFHALARDMSERKHMEAKLEHMSYHDQLTGLYNRRYFETELKRLDTEENLPMTIMMADVNGLKLVNDSFGHTYGDELLRKVADVIKAGCREHDVVSRIGGDEFVIIFPKTDLSEANHIAKRIEVLSAAQNVESIDISISLGWASKRLPEESIGEMLKKAEDHVYKKKLFESPSMRGKTIQTIIHTLHEKNRREEEHSHRVSSLCEKMGMALSLQESDVKELKSVGLLHDLGKIAIEEHLLNKNGLLTREERHEMTRHPEIGYRILSTVNDMAEMAEYVLAHHERWDGCGYPKGLKGEAIPLQARIISLADAFDAMTSDRSYRKAMSQEAAFDEINKNAGTQFDPKLAKKFVELLQ